MLQIAYRVLLVEFKILRLYEALIFLSWCFTLIHLIIENVLTVKNNFIVGVITTPTALFLNAFASFKLPESFHQFSPLIPALKSNWLMMHVTVMLLSYATLICGSVLSIAFLFLFEKKFETFIGSPNLTLTNPSKFSLNETQNYLMPSLSKFVNFVSTPSAIFLNTNSLKKSPVNPEFSLAQTSTVFEKSETTEIPTLSQPNSLDASQPEGPEGNAPWGRQKVTNVSKRRQVTREGPYGAPTQSIELMKKDFIENQKLNLLNTLDQLGFRAIGIGFPLLTIGILSGSVWANEAWGSYWSWDPKETWSFITWMVFAIYLHLRLTQKWNGVKSATLATIGFFVIWICFLGVNFLAKGLHSYGWFQ